MKKKAILIIVVSLLAVMALHLRKEQKNEPTPGRAIITAQYTNDQGDELNVYVCKAVYAEGETRKLTALELAYKEIIDPSTAEETYTYKVYGTSMCSRLNVYSCIPRTTIIIILKKVLNVKCFKRLITNIFQKNFAQFFKRPFKPAAEAAATN